MSQTPRVSKDKNGNWTITGVGERTISQTQADYEDIVKGAQQAPGQDGYNALQMLKTNPQMSSGLVTALSKNGAVPQNALVTAMAQIDATTRAQRELDAQKEAQRVSTEKFNNTIRGKFWTAFKGTTRTVFLGPQAIFEGIGNLSRGLAQGLGRAGDEIEAIKEGKVDWLTEKPTDPNLTRKDLGLAETSDLLEVFNPMNSIRQTTLYQAIKQYVDTGRVDLGVGFSASEEIGAGFLAREEQKKVAKVTFTVNGEKYERPFSAFDPITYIYTGGDLESEAARLVTAIGDLGIMIASDPFLAVSKIRKAREVAALASQTSKGIESAKNIQK